METFGQHAASDQQQMKNVECGEVGNGKKVKGRGRDGKEETTKQARHPATRKELDRTGICKARAK